MDYVTSDIHGNEERFASILKQIKLKPEDTLYVLGDALDRHKGGIRILRKIMKMPNVKMLLGNHEYMMLNAIKDKYNIRLWYNNGGKVTHEQFKHQRDDVKEEILNYLRDLPLEYRIEVNGKKYLLVHAAPAELFEQSPIRDYNSRTEFAVWHRWGWDYVMTPPGYTVIFGHTPTNHYQSTEDGRLKIWKTEYAIDIDCGSGFPMGEDPWSGQYGRLACLRLDDMKEFYSDC